ncbi:hypothetical protein AMJ40_01235 [candidate division TA06 bacterium DG_26]|uniref:Cadherin domain-containing protein n=1 Tax=candidate division TA06 bacterium DG_26 TaxID=1703771 RepID=A0A0S7WLH2_UNCT6|nr:MAG: hypothetical protein AMJ40_01235 [candidate division TA06 bacterium DG_26]
MVERHKRWTVTILISLLVLLGCKGGGSSRKEFFRVGRAYLLPERVKKGEKVELILETISEHKNIDVEIEWRKNRAPIQDVTSSDLSSFYFEKGDSIWARVQVKRYGEVVKALVLGPVLCINSPPAISNLKIASLDPSTLSAQVEYEDMDGDNVALSTNWYRNGILVHEGETFTTSHLRHGDTVLVEVTPHDGDSRGKAVVSTPVVIGNHPPTIVSAPPRLIGTHYTYRIDANDPDGDRLTYRLAEGPHGMTVDSTGVLAWTKDEHSDSLYMIEVEVLDGFGGTATQRFSLEIRKNVNP